LSDDLFDFKSNLRRIMPSAWLTTAGSRPAASIPAPPPALRVETVAVFANQKKFVALFLNFSEICDKTSLHALPFLV
jgi:hypothetical protein